MKNNWKERLERLGRANQEACDRELRQMTPERAVQLMEGLMSCHAVEPRPPLDPSDHPVSLGHRLRMPHA